MEFDQKGHRHDSKSQRAHSKGVCAAKGICFEADEKHSEIITAPEDTADKFKNLRTEKSHVVRMTGTVTMFSMICLL